jgi:hypothetical protein
VLLAREIGLSGGVHKSPLQTNLFAKSLDGCARFYESTANTFELLARTAGKNMHMAAGSLTPIAASSRQVCCATSSRPMPQVTRASLGRFEGMRRISPTPHFVAPLMSEKRISSSRRSAFVVESKAGARKVALLGAAGGIGQPLALLLKMQPYVAELSLYDIANTVGVAADLSHCNTTVKVHNDLNGHLTICVHVEGQGFMQVAF